MMILALRILRHAILQVTGNIGMAIRVSLPLIVVSLVGSFGMMRFEPNMQNGEGMGGIALFSTALTVLSLLAFLWAAVLFHIAILRPNESPARAELLRRCFGYFG